MWATRPSSPHLLADAAGFIKASHEMAGPSTGLDAWSSQIIEIYLATKPASLMSSLLSASSCSRKFSISWPARKIGLSACFSM